MNEFIEPEESTGLLTDNYFKSILEETRKWAKFLAILGFIGIGFMVLVAILMMVGMGFMDNMDNEMGSALPGMSMGVIYLIVALIYYFPVKYTYDFSKKLDHSLEGGNEQMFKDAHGSLKSLFKFMGILAIIMLSIYILAFIAVIAFAV